MTPEILATLNADRAAKRPVALVTDLATGAQKLLYPLEPAGDQNTPIFAAARKALIEDRPTQTEIDGQHYFINVFNPPLRLIIVGAVHIAQPLSQIAKLAGYHVSVIDPRTAFATAERFPGIDLVTQWPDAAMAGLAPDTRTAVVLVTHDPKLDDPALHVVLRSQAFYIGALGSKKTQGSRQARLEQAGFDAQARARIHGPVGLNINAKSPAEIAVSIMAEITQVLRREMA
jgi:xanthine dehydrogenase accessory factor